MRYGSEFVAHAVADWCRLNDAKTIFIDPESPWQNAWIESFNGRLRDEHPNGQLFDSLLEAQELTEDWRIDYNVNRPHSAHGWKSPAGFAKEWLTTHQPQLTLRVAQLMGSGQTNSGRGWKMSTEQAQMEAREFLQVVTTQLRRSRNGTIG